MITRSSLIAFFGRMVGELGDRKLQNIMISAHVVNLSIGTIIITVLLTQCRPLSSFYKMTIGSELPTGHCTSPHPISLAIGILNFLSDLVSFVQLGFLASQY